MTQMELKNGDLDYSFGILVPLLIQEAFGEAQDEKEDQERKKTYLEIKKSKV